MTEAPDDTAHPAEADDALIELAIKRAGSEDALGKAIGYSQVAINKARRGRCTPGIAAAIHEWSGGDFPADKLCPDFPWPQLQTGAPA